MFAYVSIKLRIHVWIFFILLEGTNEPKCKENNAQHSFLWSPQVMKNIKLDFCCCSTAQVRAKFEGV